MKTKTKTRFKYLTLLVSTFLIGFSSCSNDDNGGKPEDTTPKSMFLKISSEAPSTYSGGFAQGSAQVVFTSGILYFTDNMGAIKGTKTIGTLGVADIDITAVTGVSGQVITGVDGAVTKVYIVGNTPAASLPVSPTLISQVENALLQVQSQAISNVNLFGSGVLAAPVGLPSDPYTCNVTLKPTVARVELTDMAVSGNYITGYKIAGIFVDNYYSRAAVNGTVLAADLKDNSGLATPTLANAAFTDNGSLYPTALKTFVYDWFTPALGAVGTPLKVAPITGGVWGYNVFATASGSAVSRIVIRLTDVTTSADAGTPVYRGDQYVTIKGFKNTATGTPIATFKAGEVYNITGLVFNESNLTSIPSLNPIDVEVKVSVASWTPVGVTPEL